MLLLYYSRNKPYQIMTKILNFTAQDVETTSQSTLYKGFYQMQEFRFRHKLFAGGWSKEVRREMLLAKDAVAVLPYDPLTQEFVLIEQFRYGAHLSSHNPWLIEVIAGMIEEDEAPEQVCHREAFEEAGIRLLQLHKALSYMSSPGGTTERLHIYMAKVDASSAHGVHGLDSESEDILVHRIAESEAREWMQNGKIDNAAALIALQWFFLNKRSLLSDWQ